MQQPEDLVRSVAVLGAIHNGVKGLSNRSFVVNDSHMLSVLDAVSAQVFHKPLAVDFVAVGAVTHGGVGSEDDLHICAVVAGGQNCSGRSDASDRDAVHWQFSLLPHGRFVINDSDVLSVLNGVATIVCHSPLAVDFKAVGASTWDGISREDDLHVRAIVAGGQDGRCRSVTIDSDAVHRQFSGE